MSSKFFLVNVSKFIHKNNIYKALTRKYLTLLPSLVLLALASSFVFLGCPHQKLFIFILSVQHDVQGKAPGCITL
jgi:hypothetical protein